VPGSGCFNSLNSPIDCHIASSYNNLELENASQFHPRSLSVTELAYELIPLSQLAVGCCATVAAVLGVAEQVHRLHELGLCDGAPIEMLQPGSPCIVRLAGHKLCFRADDLLSVLVKPGTAI
jgi:ferrous iron transport protein A